MNTLGNAKKAPLAIFILFSCLGAASDHSEALDVQRYFTPSGWMGDGEYGEKYLKLDGASEVQPFSPPVATRVRYNFGPQGWAGIYWQNQPDNWGDLPGGNYSGRRFDRITFWARGESGGEIVEFKAGYISAKDKPYRDSFGATTGRVRLENIWTQYSIDISGTDLSSVIGGFCWVASAAFNTGDGITVYVDDIQYTRSGTVAPVTPR